MSTTLMSFEMQFKGPFENAKLDERAKLFGASVERRPQGVPQWFEFWATMERKDEAAPKSFTPELLRQVLEEDIGWKGQLPMSKLAEAGPDSGPTHLTWIGEFADDARVSAVGYIDARLLPDEPKDFHLEDSASYGGPDARLSAHICAPSRPATILRRVSTPYSEAIVVHKDVPYFGRAGLGTDKTGGLFRWDAEAPVEITLAKKAPKVHALLSDGDVLWAGCSDGLYRIEDERVTAVWKMKDGIPGRAVLSLAKHGDRLFVGASAGYAWLDDNGLEAHKDAAFKNTATLTTDEAGVLWVGTAAALFRVPGGSFEPQRVPDMRGAFKLVATSAGVYGSVFLASAMTVVLLDPTGSYQQQNRQLSLAGAIDGDLIVENHGLVRAFRDQTCERITLDHDHPPHRVENSMGRLFALFRDAIVEIDPASFRQSATFDCPLPASPIASTRAQG